MKINYFTNMLKTLSNRSNSSVVSWLGFSNTPLRRYLMEIFDSSYGNGGNFLADPTFESVFGWKKSTRRMTDLIGNLLSPLTVKAMDSPPADLAEEYRFKKDQFPYIHQLQSWEILAEKPAKSLIITSGTGSGKTECFMVPILDHLVREQEKIGDDLVGVRALFIYPLNALINSQKNRLDAWTHRFGKKIRFCLYNGNTPETVKDNLIQNSNQINDRKTLRHSPPPILVTNTTMLEYMLARAQDATIFQASQGKLEWIILDEAHTYMGSQAAELALLIRRVIHAFGTNHTNIRFIATSATMGDSDSKSDERLKQFLANLSGIELSNITLVSANREIPKLPLFANSTEHLIPRKLAEIEAGKDLTPLRYRELSKQPIALKIRNLFTDPNKPFAKLSDVCSVIFGVSKNWNLSKQQEALSWLDLLTSTIDSNNTPFLPLRAHIFHQTLSGLWCCSDPKCPTKQNTKLDHPDWLFGQVFLSPQSHCTCGAPVYEFVSCDECGSTYLLAEINNDSVVPINTESTIDEFELEIDDESSEEDESIEDKSIPSLGNRLLITNHNFDETGEIILNRRTRKITEKLSLETLTITAYEESGNGIDCRVCLAKDKQGTLFRKARIGAPFLLGGLLPALLEYVSDGKSLDRPYRGRRLLTFNDSRQGTARLATKLQQDSERMTIRSLIYHHVLRIANLNVAVKKDSLEKEIQWCNNLLVNPKMPSAAKEALIKKRDENQEELSQVTKGQAVSFQSLRNAIAQEGREFRYIFDTYKNFWGNVFGDDMATQDLAGMLILREFARRPKRQNNLETMGMIAVQYPSLEQIRHVPKIWVDRRFTPQEWKNFLKIILDYFVRDGWSLDIPIKWKSSIGFKFHRKFLNESKWPSAKTSKLRNRIVRLLAYLTEINVETSIGQDFIDSLLQEAWLEIRKIMVRMEAGYILSPEEMAFSVVSHAWICPVTRRFLDTTIRDVTPYLPRIEKSNIRCESVNIPVYPLPFGDETNVTVRIEKARNWLEQQNDLIKLREEGLWSSTNDRIIESAPYFSVAEHSAQQSAKLLDRYERDFKEGKINLLSCSTTMEMGIDIGGIQIIAMNNVPPHPANYLQRAGRAGRRNETQSAAITLCRSNPHDQNVFRDTSWAFITRLPLPFVSLNSATIVQRHINAMILRYFLLKVLKAEKDTTKLKCGWFLENKKNGPSKKFVAWCKKYTISEPLEEIEDSIRKLVQNSLFETHDTFSLVKISGDEMSKVFKKWQAEWQVLLVQEKELGSKNNTKDPVFKAINYQKSRLSDEYLLRELSVQGFLPRHGFPTAIASFDNMTLSAAKKLKNDALITQEREDNKFRKRNLANRDLTVALREYAPGSELIIDGRVYKSAGITLNWHIPASEREAQETQAIKFAWRCQKCGTSGSSVSRKIAQYCNACDGKNDDGNIEEFLEPSGFAVDFYDEPHNDVTTQQFIPIERPWINARGEWVPLPNSRLGRFRVADDGLIYHHSKGIHGRGYALCLVCGRAEPMLPNNQLPKNFAANMEHNRLRSSSDNKICPGSHNSYKIKTKIVLGYQTKVDILEIQIKDINGQWIEDRSTALTIAVALRDALAKLLGVHSNELDCDVEERLSQNKKRCQSLFVFDRFAAGYTANAESCITEMFRNAQKQLNCPNNCDSSCPYCILDFDKRFEAATLNRKAALEILTTTWLNALEIP